MWNGGTFTHAAGRTLICLLGIAIAIVLAGCAHYRLNQELSRSDPEGGYRGKNFIAPDKDESLLILLTFSGGGTRAAAFSYGVLETLRDTNVIVHGSERRLLDQVDWISGVSGGSFTAAYYGLFRDRIFEDFESRFLKKDIQGEIKRAILFNPVNWAKLFSPYYDRSDLAADYYNKNVFDGGTFGDILARKQPIIMINATDMVHGTRFSFNQDTFDAICSDLLSFPVARACAASSAVPIVLSPVTLRNYAGSCGYHMPEPLEEALKTAERPGIAPLRPCQQHGAFPGFEIKTLHPPRGWRGSPTISASERPSSGLRFSEAHGLPCNTEV